jgi:menaquinone-specific isochorismate synthase
MTTVADTARRLTARTARLDDGAADLVGFAGDDGVLFEWAGFGLAARGVAMRLPATEVGPALAAMSAEDEVGLPGCGPVAMGALPFWPQGPSTLVVPREVLGRWPDGQCWFTTIGEPGPTSSPPSEASPPPDSFTLDASPSHDQWCSQVSAAVERIRDGVLHKVVLAREVVVRANRPIRATSVLGRLRDLYPSCAIYSVEGFVGASPELLVSRRGERVRSQPLAGTIPRSGDPEVDERRGAGLMASHKDRYEHRLVVEAVASALQPFCAELEVPDQPKIVPLRNVCHLGTVVSGQLSRDSRPPSALELALALHPTPAVAGVPTAEALACIAELETLDRGFYAGAVGWMDARGDGQWAVGIRSGQLSGTEARLRAGVGVVADSDPDEELAETQLKLQALLAAVVRP